MMRQVKFQDGRIDLLGQRVCLTPRDIPVGLTNFILKDPKRIPEIYETIRLSFDAGWAPAVKRAYGFGAKEYFKWLMDMSSFGGWGKSELSNFDQTNLTGNFKVVDSIMGEYFKGKVSEPIC